MSMGWMPPGSLKAFSTELRARQYHDPIQKLAYLRRVARKAALIRRPHLSWYSRVLLLLVFLGARLQTVTEVNAGLPHSNLATKTPDTSPIQSPNPLGAAWLVEHRQDYDLYSNGLRIENEFVTPNEPRSYVIFRDGITSERYSKPAGIVLHTSESVQVPFTSEQNNNLTRIGRELLAYVSRHHAYHFVIDRFGRVFRIVPETDSANHAGNSVWADQEGVYLNLNHCFLGVSFEAQTRDINGGNYLSPSQIRSGRLLLEMLVSKYNIPLTNCITHSQVSVDPDTMTIGHHTDGSGDFPFQDLGLPDNYALPLPSLFVFGFDYDTRFLVLTGSRVWKGLMLADEQLRRDANSQHLSLDQHKEILRERYRTYIAKLKTLSILKEN